MKIGGGVVPLGMIYRVVSQIDDGLAAEGTGSVVAYNYGVRIKAALPDAVVERIRALENNQLAPA